MKPKIWLNIIRVIVISSLYIWVNAHYCYAVFDERDWNDFYQNYYCHPQPDKISDALDYYIFAGKQLTLKNNFQGRKQLEAWAYFFAVISQDRLEVSDYAETHFSQFDWQAKMDFCAIIKRTSDVSLKSKLIKWAKQEPDEDRQIFLEQIANSSDKPLTILSDQPKSTNELEAQWACFFATGNTRVVDYSLEILANTITSQTNAFNRDLARDVWDDLAKRSFRHATIFSLVLQSSWLINSENGRKMLLQFAGQALTMRNIPMAKKILLVAQKHFENSPELVFYQSAIAALEGTKTITDAGISVLKNDELILAYWLSAYCGWNQQLQREATWEPTAIPAGGKNIVLRCEEYLKQIPPISVFEIWDLPGSIMEEQTGVFSMERVLIIDKEQRCGLLLNDTPFEAWYFKSNHLLRWVRQRPEWTEINNRLFKIQAVKMLSRIEMLYLLKNRIPISINKIKTSDGLTVAAMTFDDIGEWQSINHSLQYISPGSRAVISKIIFYLDYSNGQIFHIRINLTIKDSSGNRQGTIERFISPLAVPLLGNNS